VYNRGELPGRFMAKVLFGWNNKRYDNKYWSHMERNWRRWKGKKLGREYRKKKIETIPEILPEEESWRGGTVITPSYIEELDDKGRLVNNKYLHYKVTDEEHDRMGGRCVTLMRVCRILIKEQSDNEPVRYCGSNSTCTHIVLVYSTFVI